MPLSTALVDGPLDGLPDGRGGRLRRTQSGLRDGRLRPPAWRLAMDRRRGRVPGAAKRSAEGSSARDARSVLRTHICPSPYGALELWRFAPPKGLARPGRPFRGLVRLASTVDTMADTLYDAASRPNLGARSPWRTLCARRRRCAGWRRTTTRRTGTMLS
ncbi:hypothetical protein M885DRAFT_183233 [Pelagophyceae sp. CCMP2097]|nr:hypothetical protein M885DRAFT_183233 [Pelagophyceae sp. CCMP2097]